MNNPLATLFDQFLKERTYLKNVTPATLRWYRIAFKSYRKAIPDDAAQLPTRATLQEFVIRLRDRGVQPITCNTYVVAINAFCAWLHEEGHAAGRVKLSKLRVERRVLSVLDETQMRVLIGYKPTLFGQRRVASRRVHLAAMLILDSGLRIAEALSLRHESVDSDNLVLKVSGKGQKERLVPFSPELRKRLYRLSSSRPRRTSAATSSSPGSAARDGRNGTTTRRST